MALAMPAVAVPPAPAGAELAASGQQLTGLAFFTLPPCRVVDTRASLPLLPGIQLFPLAGYCGIPACASAVSANLTIVRPQSPGYLTVFAGDSQLPATSNLNFRAGQVRANNAIVQLADDGAGTVGVYYGGTASADLILDVNGYFESTANPTLVSVSPPTVSQNGGALLLLAGSFPSASQTGVLIGQQAASPDATSTATTLRVPAPPFTGTFPTQPCMGPGGETGTRNTSVSVDVTVTDPTTGCSSTAAGALTYIPNDSSCHLLPP